MSDSSNYRGVCLQPQSSKPFEKLEDRILMSGTASPAPHSAHAPATISIALIDSTLPDQKQIDASVGKAERIVYNPKTESASQVLAQAVADARREGNLIKSVMIFSHGADGAFDLGGDIVSSSTLSKSAAAWKSLGASLAPGASINLFGCDVGAGASGSALLDQLHSLSGGEIYASTDITGKGGNWTLETHSAGAPDQISPISVADLQDYPSDLSLISLTTPATAAQSVVSGLSTALSVLGGFPLGEALLNYTWSTVSTPNGGTATFSNNANNLAKNVTATFSQAGAYTLLCTISNGLLSLTSSVPVIVQQTLSSLNVTSAAQSTPLNGTLQFVASGLDQFGNPLSTQPSISWATDNGVINAAGDFIAPATAGISKIIATVGALTGIETVNDINTAPVITTAANASANPATGNQITLNVLGSDDQGSGNLTYTWSTVSGPAPVVFSTNDTNASHTVTATFSGAGTYVLQVTISDGTNSISQNLSETVNQTLSSLRLNTASSSLPLSSTLPLACTALDQFGQPLSLQPIINWSTTLGAITQNGLFTAPASAGLATVTAAVGSINATSALNVLNAALTIGLPAAASPGLIIGTTTGLSALGATSGLASTLSYTWSTVGTPIAPVLFSANASNLAQNVTATFAKPGFYTLQCLISNGINSVVTSVDCVVNATLSRLVVTPAATTLCLNAQTALSATGLDQFGQPLLTQPATSWVSNLGSITGEVLTAPDAPGILNVTAAVGSIIGNATIAVVNTAPTLATAPSCVPLAGGVTATLSALGADDGGESALTYAWNVVNQPTGANVLFSANGANNAKNCNCTFNRAGNYTFAVTVTDAQGAVATQNVSMTVPQTPTTIAINTPATSVVLGAALSINPVVTDQFGQVCSSATPTLSIVAGGAGAIVGNSYVAPFIGGGTATVNATISGVTSTAAITLTTVKHKPSKLTPVSVTRTSSTSVQIDLSSSVLNAGGPGCSYIVQQAGKPFTQLGTIVAGGSNVNITGLHAGEKCRFRILPINPASTVKLAVVAFKFGG